MKSENINELAEALAKAQGEIEGAAKSAINPHGNYKYADLSSVWSACREPLSKNGLAVCQVTEIEGEQVILVTTLMHKGGQWIAGKMPVRIAPMFDKGTNKEKPWTPQAFGSAITYARKYSLLAMVGVAGEDDDGQAASDTATPAARSMIATKPNGFRIAPTLTAEQAAERGTEAFREWWKELDAVEREALKPRLKILQDVAAGADHMAAMKVEGVRVQEEGIVP